MPAGKRLRKIVDVLAKRYEAEGGKCELTDLRDPFLLGAWHILGQHAKRNGQPRAFEALRRAKGTTPGSLLDLAPDKLATICQTAGPYEDARAKELYAFADAIEEKCGQDFGKVFKKPLADARKFLERDLGKSRAFADFLLLYGGAFPVFPVDARVVRAAQRMGLVKIKSEKCADDKTYKAVQRVLESEAPKNAGWLIRAHSVFCRLAMDTCYATVPYCERCALRSECVFAKEHPPQENPNPGGQKTRAAWHATYASRRFPVAGSR
jgi:endonuclease III